MPVFEPFDVVAVPFPYVERPAQKRRPTVVASQRSFQGRTGFVRVLMITSADNPVWPDDIPIDDLTLAGLPHASVIRSAKIATVETDRCERRGCLSAPAIAALRETLHCILSLP